MVHRGASFREAGAGVPVVCIHASASSSGQWRPLMERLAGRFRSLAVDLYGYGQSPPWPDERPLSLTDEAALIEPVLEAVGDPVHVIGHSYGGAVALKAALVRPGPPARVAGAAGATRRIAGLDRDPPVARAARRHFSCPGR